MTYIPYKGYVTEKNLISVIFVSFQTTDRLSDEKENMRIDSAEEQRKSEILREKLSKEQELLRVTLFVNFPTLPKLCTRGLLRITVHTKCTVLSVYADRFSLHCNYIIFAVSVDKTVLL